VYRYTPAEDAEAEFGAEWGRLGTYLKDHGGLDDAVRQIHALVETSDLQKTKITRIRQTLSRIERANEA
jgi:hypothetical protein